MAESGFPGFVITVWFALYAPSGTPPERVARLHEAFAAALKDPAVKAKLEQAGLDIIGSSAAEFGLHLIVVMERKPGTPTTYEKAVDQVRDCYLDDLRQNLLANLRSRATIQVAIP